MANLEWGYGRMPDNAYPRAPLTVIFHALWVLLVAFVRREHRPNALFGTDDEPIVTPSILTKDERQALAERATAWREERSLPGAAQT